MLDRQKKIFEYAMDPVTCPSPSIVDPATDPYANLRSVSKIYSISTNLQNPSYALPKPSPTVSGTTMSVVMGSTWRPLSSALLMSASRSSVSSVQTLSSMVSHSTISSLETRSSVVSHSIVSSLQTPSSMSWLASARSPPQDSVGGSQTSSQEGVYKSP